MSKSNHFRQYAEEAMRPAVNPKSERESFIELARTWTVAAVQSEQSYAVACESCGQPMWRIAPVGRVSPAASTRLANDVRDSDSLPGVRLTGA